MGLDILLMTDNYENIRDANSYNEHHFKKFRLSRTFCNFMCRQHLENVEPELDQIGKLTGIDISHIYNMERYVSQEEAEFRLFAAETESEKGEINAGIIAEREMVRSNMGIVSDTIDSLIQKLSGVEDLRDLLDDSGRDTLGYDLYFADFNVDKGDGYIGNNFGQDIRNFKCFLEFAKNKGANSVWFVY